jgi:hypothetical protein
LIERSCEDKEKREGEIGVVELMDMGKFIDVFATYEFYESLTLSVINLIDIGTAFHLPIGVLCIFILENSEGYLPDSENQDRCRLDLTAVTFG